MQAYLYSLHMMSETTGWGLILDDYAEYRAVQTRDGGKSWETAGMWKLDHRDHLDFFPLSEQNMDPPSCDTSLSEWGTNYTWWHAPGTCGGTGETAIRSKRNGGAGQSNGAGLPWSSGSSWITCFQMMPGCRVMDKTSGQGIPRRSVWSRQAWCRRQSCRVA
ncbi:MAG TPA: hypothetical protein VFN35_22135 [Ktedonobacteraceae bacterium]|nr:hypothetical protein [Ktedonobacteraceae bacterium]